MTNGGAFVVEEIYDGCNHCIIIKLFMAPHLPIRTHLEVGYASRRAPQRRQKATLILHHSPQPMQRLHFSEARPIRRRDLLTWMTQKRCIRFSGCPRRVGRARKRNTVDPYRAVNRNRTRTVYGYRNTVTRTVPSRPMLFPCTVRLTVRLAP
jgi:hypothetical protein